MAMTLGEAAAATGRSRSTLLRAIRRGLVSASRDAKTGGFVFDEAELARAFTLSAPAAPAARLPRSNEAPRRADMAALLAAAEARLADATDQIADLRRRLDRADEERRQTQGRLDALLTAPPRRSWWRWRQ